MEFVLILKEISNLLADHATYIKCGKVFLGKYGLGKHGVNLSFSSKKEIG